MFKNLRTTFILGILLIGIAAVMRVVSTNNTANNANVPVETSVVNRGDIAITVNATGNIQANQNVSLAFAVNGKVTAINVKEGDYVRKGQTIAIVDDEVQQDALIAAQEKVTQQQLALNKLMEKPRPVDIQVAQANVAVAQAQLAESQISPTDAAQVQIAQTNIDIAKNQLWQAELARDISNLRARKPNTPVQVGVVVTDNTNGKAIASADLQITVAQQQLKAVQSQGANGGSIEAAQAGLTSAQIQLKALQDGPDPNDVKQAQANLAAAQAGLDQAKQDLLQTRLVAPFDGLVARINLSLGQAAPATDAADLLDTSSYYVDLPIAETDIARVKAGMAVNLRFDSLPGSIVPGKVLQISDVANTGSPVTYNVRVSITPAGQPLLSTMTTTAAVVISNASNVMRLANRFIRLDTAKQKAYATVRQPDGTFKEIEIQIGTANDTYTEIKSGLNVGDVVTTPQTSSGQRGPNGFAIRALTGG